MYHPAVYHQQCTTSSVPPSISVPLSSVSPASSSAPSQLTAHTSYMVTPVRRCAQQSQFHCIVSNAVQLCTKYIVAPLMRWCVVVGRPPAARDRRASHCVLHTPGSLFVISRTIIALYHQNPQFKLVGKKTLCAPQTEIHILHQGQEFFVMDKHLILFHPSGRFSDILGSAWQL